MQVVVSGPRAVAPRALLTVVLGVLGTVAPVGAASAAAWPDSSRVTNCSDSGAGSLRAAVAAGSAETITFKLSCETIVLLSPIVLTSNVDLRGPGTARLTIDGNGTTRLLVVPAGVNATISKVTLANGNAGSAPGGGAILNQGVLTLEAVHLVANVAQGVGGAITNLGQLIVRDGSFRQNGTSPACSVFGCLSIGGAIANLGVATITGSDFTTNTVTGDPLRFAVSGGAIAAVLGGSADISGSTFVDNQSSSQGGAIFAFGSSLSVAGSRFSHNVAGAGGAIGSERDFGTSTIPTLTVSHSRLSDNAATGLIGAEGAGGAINVFGVDASIDHTTIADNTVTGDTPTSVALGAGIANFNGVLTLDHVALTGNVNTAGAGFGFGGAVWNSTPRPGISSVSVTFSEVVGNRAESGAAIYQVERPSSTASTSVHHSRFADNVDSSVDIVPGVCLEAGPGGPGTWLTTFSKFL